MQDNPHPDEHPEPIDSVPDADQEHRGLDSQTRKRMERDTGEDETHLGVLPVAGSRIDTSTTPERGHASGEKIRRVRNQEGTDRITRVNPDDRLRETSDGVPDHLQEVGSGSSDSETPDQELTPEQYQYRIVATLPASIQQLIDEALAAVNLQDWIRGFQLQSAFRTEHLPEVNEILQNWGQKHLPLASRLLGVHTEVWAQNQYITGWKINNVAAWHQAQNELTVQLAPFITADTNTASAFRPFIGLLEYTPAAIYPHLVGYLNRQYHPLDFQIEQISLLRMPLIQHATRVPIGQRNWQVYQDFPTLAQH